MTLLFDAPTAVPGRDLTDPVAVARGLREQFRPGAADRDRDRAFPFEQCDAFRASGLARCNSRGRYALTTLFHQSKPYRLTPHPAQLCADATDSQMLQRPLRR